MFLWPVGGPGIRSSAGPRAPEAQNRCSLGPCSSFFFEFQFFNYCFFPNKLKTLLVPIFFQNPIFQLIATFSDFNSTSQILKSVVSVTPSGLEQLYISINHTILLPVNSAREPRTPALCTRPTS